MLLFLGKWNGFGGKVEANEGILEGAIREVKEECGLDLEPNDVVKLGLIGKQNFYFKNPPLDGDHLEVSRSYVFSCSSGAH